MTKSEVLIRLDYLARKFGFTAEKLAEIFQYKDAMSYANAKSKGRILKDDDIRALLREVPDLNLNWLFKGSEPMLLGGQDQQSMSQEAPADQAGDDDKQHMTVTLAQDVTEAQDYILMLDKRTERLEQKLDELYTVLDEIRRHLAGR